MVRGLDDDTLQETLDHREIDGLPNDEAAMDELVGSFLERIHVAEAFTSNHQIFPAETAWRSPHDAGEDHPVRLACVDSLTAHFRAEQVGRGELADRQQKLDRNHHHLEKIGSLHDAAVVVTDQV